MYSYTNPDADLAKMLLVMVFDSPCRSAFQVITYPYF